MRKKKRKLKKKPFILMFIFVCFVLVVLFFINNKTNVNIEDKLSDLGYSSNEVKAIVKNVSKNNYNLISKKYNKSLVDLITANDYKEENFKKYLEYYDNNSKANVDDIIAIINSGYDLTKYPASSLLASLVKEKYYIHKNVTRYLDYGNSHDYLAKKVIAIVNAKADYAFYTETEKTNIKDDNLVLVNKFYHLSDSYEPDDLVTLSSKYNQGANNNL